MTNAPLAQTVTPGVKVGEGKDVLEGGGVGGMGLFYW